MTVSAGGTYQPVRGTSGRSISRLSRQGVN